ncbi:DUF4440 domain-containing protein [Chlorobaculum sp. 24CR]|nr:DUF4440 domain-containing protein [Chlorobaculum sp. 24CR]
MHSEVSITSTPNTMHYQNAEDVLAEWISGICAGEIDNVARLYHEQAILIPTFSPHTVSTPQGIRHYFEQLATRDNLQARLYEKSLRKQCLGGTAWILSGTYAFEFEVDQLLLTFPSRFTFAVNLEHERPIVHHHSSQVPRNLS